MFNIKSTTDVGSARLAYICSICSAQFLVATLRYITLWAIMTGAPVKFWLLDLFSFNYFQLGLFQISLPAFIVTDFLTVSIL